MHVLILGRTGTGKTTLAKSLARQYRQRGVAVLVWSPLPHEFSSCATETWSDLERFIARVFSIRRCAVFIDEAGEAVSQRQLEQTAKVATRSRHLAHSVHFISQRAAGLVAPLVRDQCERAYVFRVSKTDAKALASEYGHAELTGASALVVRPGESSEYFVSDWRGCAKRTLALKG